METETSCEFYDIGCHFRWLQAELKALALYVWDAILQGLASLIGALPVPDFLQNIGTFSLPPDVIFWLGLFKVHYGIGLVVSAYIARFLLRRIPLIG